MEELLDHLDDELDSRYFMDFEKNMNSQNCPMDLDEFMRMEMVYYDRYMKNRTRRGRMPSRKNPDNLTAN